MQSKKKRVESAHVSTLPVVEVLVVITITTALLLGVIIATNPLASLLSSSNQDSTYTFQPFPTLDQARDVIHGGMSFTTAMNDFPQVIGGYIAPYHKPQVGDPFYLEVHLRDRVAPITEVIARIEGQNPKDIPMKLIDGTEQEGTWGAIWEYTGEDQIKIISYDEKKNVTEVGIQ